MPWLPTHVFVTGELVTAAQMNAIGGNLTELRLGGVALAGQLAGDLPFATSGEQWGRDGALTYDETVLRAPQMAPTDPAPAAPVPGRLYADALCTARAVVTYVMGAPTLDAGVNVAALVDNGVGDVTVTFATPLTATAYSAVVTPIRDGQDAGAGLRSKADGSCRVQTNDNSNAAADRAFDLIVLGGN